MFPRVPIDFLPRDFGILFFVEKAFFYKNGLNVINNFLLGK